MSVYREIENPAYDPDEEANFPTTTNAASLASSNESNSLTKVEKLTDDELREIHEESVNEWHLRRMYDSENDEGE
jgi:hypothetical protein